MNALERRNLWINKIHGLGKKFGPDTAQVETDLRAEIKDDGHSALVEHLRFCGDIPEGYGHDSSEEKLYSKYTDTLLSCCFEYMGHKSLIIRSRADVADVEVFANDYAFVADAKAFRLSRTAKNQKDFKVASMDRWKHGKKYALVVCPVHQMPAKTSQIYYDASTRNVCILSYTHMAVLVRLAVHEKLKAQCLLKKSLDVPPLLSPSKDAASYWATMNKEFIGPSKLVKDMWLEERQEAATALIASKELALAYFAGERERVMRMSHEAAIKELLAAKKIKSREEVVRAVTVNSILDFGH